MLRAVLIIGGFAVWAHAGVVVIGSGLAPVAGQPVLFETASDVTAARAALGVNHVEFPVASHPFTLDWLANRPPLWPDSGITRTRQGGANNSVNPRVPPAETAKWFGVCGALILLFRRSVRH